MDIYLTEIKAECPYTGNMKKWCGPNVPGISFADAQDYCENNGLGYCKVVGRLVAEVDAISGEVTDYETPKLN